MGPNFAERGDDLGDGRVARGLGPVDLEPREAADLRQVERDPVAHPDSYLRARLRGARVLDVNARARVVPEK